MFTPTLPLSTPTLSAEQMANQDTEDAAQLAAQETAAVKGEIYRWKQVPLCSMDKPLNLVRFWEVNSILNHIMQCLSSDVSIDGRDRIPSHV